MKNTSNLSLTRTILLRMGFALLLYTAACIAGYYLLDNLLDGFSLEFLHDYLDPRAFAWVNTHRTTTTVSVYFTGFVIIMLVTLLRVLSHLHTISTALDTVLDEHAPVGVFASDLAPIELKLRDIKLQVSNDRLLAHEAEQRKNDLVVYLAHDLKTPLSSVIGYLSLLDESPDLPAEQRARFTGIALDKAYRLEQLINEFFDITRFNLQSVELERSVIDLSVMLAQMVDEFYPVFAENALTVETQIAPGVKIVGDADKLARVFDNLLRNAVNYSYPDTAVVVSLLDGADACTITFINHGDEIPATKLERIFEKFFRLDASRSTRRGGAGLGLAIAKQIIELHGGKITAHSTVDATEFRVELPKVHAKM